MAIDTGTDEDLITIAKGLSITSINADQRTVTVKSLNLDIEITVDYGSTVTVDDGKLQVDKDEEISYTVRAGSVSDELLYETISGGLILEVGSGVSVESIGSD